MRKSDLKKNHEPLDAAFKRYRAFLNKVIHAQRVIGSPEEKRDIAESVLLRLCAYWEKFLDQHLVDCANRYHAKLSTHFAVTIPANPSWQLCHALIIGASYKDFKSFGDLKGFSKRILDVQCNPFLAVKSASAKRIDEVYAIRNYLSHYSAASRRTLMNIYKSEYDMSRFLEPGHFMLAYNAKRLWAYFDAFESASADMLAWCDNAP